MPFDSASFNLLDACAEVSEETSTGAAAFAALHGAPEIPPNSSVNTIMRQKLVVFMRNFVHLPFACALFVGGSESLAEGGVDFFVIVGGL